MGGVEAEVLTGVTEEGGDAPTKGGGRPPQSDAAGPSNEDEPSRATEDLVQPEGSTRLDGGERDPRSPSPRPNFARLRALMAPWATQVAAGLGMAAEMTPAEATPTTLTCTVLEQPPPCVTASLGWVATAGAMVVLATVAILAFALGRWTAARNSAEAYNEAEPWVVITEANEMEPKEVRRAGVRVTTPGTKEVASQAPCTYTVVRGHLRGRFLPLPDNAHG